MVSSSGFEDIVFQSKLCSAGSFGSVLCGSHYNRSWVIHNAITEAVEPLLLRFFGETKIQLPESLVKISADPELFSPNIQDESAEFHYSSELFKQTVRDVKLGKTQQFWLLYLDMSRNQHMIHLAVQENNFDLRLAAWKNCLSLYFATNQFNYARYGSNLGIGKRRDCVSMFEIAPPEDRIIGTSTRNVTIQSSR